MKQYNMDYTQQDLEQMSEQELQAALEWVNEQLANGEDYRA